MLALAIPFILLTLLLCAALCLYKRWFIACGILILVTIVCNCVQEVYPLNIFLSRECNRQYFRVLSFNINGSGTKTTKEISHLASFILKQDADVVFLAEDFENVSELLDSLIGNKYPYTTYHQRNPYGGHYFYSKYPLGLVEHLEMESIPFSYCFRCRMAFVNDSVNLFGVHMVSNNYQEGYHASIRPDDIDGAKSLKSYLDNIEAASSLRCEEATKVRDLSIKLGGTTIVMGDFNDVSGSKPLNILEDAGFKDAWWEGGFGYGATIHHPLPFRIDHIMYNDGLELVEIKKVDSNGLSDHDALVATFKLKVK